VDTSARARASAAAIGGLEVLADLVGASERKGDRRHRPAVAGVTGAGRVVIRPRAWGTGRPFTCA
jgi:hypothetical protein